MWRIAHKWTSRDGMGGHDAAPSPINFTGLAGANEICILVVQAERSEATNMGVRVSTNNGASFYSSVGDYVSVDVAGVATDQDHFRLNTALTTNARSGIINLFGTNVNGIPKVDSMPNQARRGLFKGSLAPIDAVQVFAIDGGDFDRGDIFCLVRELPQPIWEVAAVWDHAVDGDQLLPLTFAGLAGAQDIMLLLEGVTKADATGLRMFYSFNNGSWWMDNDSRMLSDAGTSSSTSAGHTVQVGNNLDARTCHASLLAAGITGVDFEMTARMCLQYMDGSQVRMLHSNTADVPINAIQIRNTANIGFNTTLTGGKITCLVSKVSE